MKSKNSSTPKPTSNTNPIGGPRLLLDYVMISFIGTTPSDVSSYLFPNMVEDFEVLESSMPGFSSVLTNRVLFIHYDNKGVKDVVLLEIRSIGCRFLEQQVDHSWLSFFRSILEMQNVVTMEKFSVKRMDIAIDSFSRDTLTPDRMVRSLNQNLVSSRFRTSRIIRELRVKTSDLSGSSISFGKRSSDLYILVYDKQLESQSATSWFRTEIRFRNFWGKKAMMVLLNQPDRFSEFISDVLKTNVQFRSSLHKRSELRRRPLSQWYESYLLYVKRQVLFGIGEGNTPDAK